MVPPHSPAHLWLALIASVFLLPVTAALAQPNSDLKKSPVVPGFARFFQDGKEPARGGQLLLNELNCISCHAPGKAIETAFSQKSAPVLDSVGSRVKPAYLKQFLADPQGIKPGTTMPSLFAGLDEQDKHARVDALVHFLASTGNLKQERPDRKSIAGGRDLFHKVGCVACHGTRDAKGEPDKVLPTSVPLTNLKGKYTLASLKTFLGNPHQTRPSGRMPGLLDAKEAVEVANYLLQGAAPAVAAENMKYSYYEGSWDNLPDFAQLKPVATGKATDFDLSVARRINNCALKFDGFLKIEKKGTYTFHTTSDDGSKLWLDDKLVINNDGIHPPTHKSGKVKLEKGMHKLTLGVFNGGGGFELSVEIEGPGNARQPMGPMVFLDDKVVSVPEAALKTDADVFVLQPHLVAKGKELFGSMGCANCHQLKQEKKHTGAPALALLKIEGGCLEGIPKKGIPWYSLNGVQKAALRAALQAPAPVDTDPNVAIARTMTTFNCYACHERNKVGGVEDETNKFFQTSQPEAGEEVRIPPPLNGVGAKLNDAYLRKVLDQGAHDRPYMHTRMPKFGNANVGHLVKLLETADVGAPDPKVVAKVPPAKLKAAARQLVGGQGFGCIKCHTFAGTKAEGVQGMDLAIMTQRLRKDWFHSYMIDPNKYRPGTRMPSSFPDGQTVLKKVLDGTAPTQLEAIWVYLSDGKSATLPLGLNKQSIPLVPTTEAIIYRNFIQGAGARAIGVGYPEKAHLAFDANDIRLAMIWQGAFMDARRHWTDRGVGFEPPMGDNVMTLPTGPSFAVLSQPEEPWPALPAKQLGYKFLGYHLSDNERPTFVYKFHGIHVEDFPNAMETKANPGIHRVLTLTAEAPVEKLYFRAAVGDKIESAGDGWYRINDWRMRIESSAMPEIRRVGSKMELVVPVRFQNNSAKIVQDFAW